MSWTNKRQWWKPVVAQLLLLGIITFISASYSDSTGPGSFSTHSKTNWSVNGFWTGAYEDECRWYSKLMEVLDVPTLDVLITVLGLVFGVVAPGAKLRIVEDVEVTVQGIGVSDVVGPGFHPRPAIRVRVVVGGTAVCSRV